MSEGISQPDQPQTLEGQPSDKDLFSKFDDIIAPFNKKEDEITNETTFQNDLEFDSLTVMDFVAEIEDEFDVIISMNQQAEIETYGQLVTAVHKLQDS